MYERRCYCGYSQKYCHVRIESQATDLERRTQSCCSGWPEQDWVERPSEPRGGFTGRNSCCTAHREL